MKLEVAATGAVSESVAQLVDLLGRDGDVLSAALGCLDWVAALPNAAAPGFVYLAGACRGLAVGGGGRDLVEAAGKLAGETSEALVGMRRGGVQTVPGLSVDPALRAIWGEGPAVLGESLASGRAVALPAAAVFRDIDAGEGAPPRSLGAGAGASREAARLSGLLELVERDAAAAWWSGATVPRAVAVEDAARAAAMLAGMRAGAAGPGRRTVFLVLPSATGLPVAAALSRDGDGAGGLVVGLKAALELEAALIGATLELLQMEIGLEIVRLRAQAGRAAPEDAATLRRAAVDPDAHAAFACLPPRPAAGPGLDGLDALVAHLARIGIEPMAVDLDGPPGVAVAKVFAPGLRPMPGPGPAPAAGSPATVAELF
ncbi:YcaO-like family protein [Amaricoccus sp.]|uniref:YcaO-like family protein n=1 Tax=Amaricoccus sp. TaxID=1872485 RepID=UPI001B5A8BE8|nr:YcaO-like family protein [Amaricoccus sp.]MBP7242294.1 YcaO-like family protein [Amaricoccus sp.]